MLEGRKARKLHREDRHDRALLAVHSSGLPARSPAFCRLVSPCMASRSCSAHGRFLDNPCACEQRRSLRCHRPLAPLQSMQLLTW